MEFSISSLEGTHFFLNTLALISMLSLHQFHLNIAGIYHYIYDNYCKYIACDNLSSHHLLQTSNCLIKQNKKNKLSWAGPVGRADSCHEYLF